MKSRKYILLLMIAFSLLPMGSANAQGRHPISLESTLITAIDAYQQKRYDRATELLTWILKLSPKNDAAHYYLGMTAFMTDDYEKAERELREAVNLDADNFWYRYRLASYYAVTDRPEITIDMYESLLRDFPKKSELYYDLIDLYISQGMTDKALETLSQIETVFGKSDATAMMRFNLLGHEGKQEEAYASLEEFNKEYSSAQVLSVLGDYQMSQYNDSLALALYDEALDITPGFAPAMLGKIETYRMTRRYDDYFSNLRTFIKDESISPSGKSEYLRAVATRADPNFIRIFQERLDTVVEECMETHPSDSSVLTMAGVYYYGTGRGDLAKYCFLENMMAWPESASAAAGYGELLTYLQKWEELSDIGRYAWRKFKDAGFLEMAIYGDYNLKRYEDVVELCETIISVSPKDTARLLNSYVTIGDAYHQAGMSSKSFKAYEKALKINPNYNYLLNNYAYFLSLEGKKLKKAYSMSKKTIESEPDNATYLDTYGWILYLMGRSEEAKPVFKHAMLYGGKDSAETLDHYAEVLFDLEEYDLAFLYWNQALSKDVDNEFDIENKIKERKASIKNR